MTISNHRVVGAIDDPINGGAAMPVRRCIVLHFTGGASGASSVEAMKQRGVSAHVVVERDGSIRQCRPFNEKCSHAGASRWQDPKTGKMYGSANEYGISIEIANAGSDPGALKWAKKQGCKTRMAKHRNGGPIQEWEEFPDAQIKSVTDLCVALVKQYNLDDITGHDCIAPERKDDPGPCLPMESIRDACGFGRTLPKVHKK